MANPFEIAAQGGPQPQPQAPQIDPRSQPDNLDHLEASFDKLQSAQGMLSKVRNGLDSLVKLADTVTQDDVVKVAGKLVASGMTPEGMASLLSEMPEQPEQLMQWIAQHDQQVNQRIEETNKMADLFAHQMGVEGVKRLLSNGTGGAASPQEPTAQPQNALAGAPAAGDMSPMAPPEGM